MSYRQQELAIQSIESGKEDLRPTHFAGTTVSLMSGVQGPGMPMRMSLRQVSAIGFREAGQRVCAVTR